MSGSDIIITIYKQQCHKNAMLNDLNTDGGYKKNSRFYFNSFIIVWYPEPNRKHEEFYLIIQLRSHAVQLFLILNYNLMQ